MAERPRVAAEGMATDIIQAVTTVIAELAEVRGLPVMDTLPVQPELGCGAKRLVAKVAGVPTQSRVQGLVGLQAVPTCGAECTEPAAVRPGSLVLQGHVLSHAAGLFAAEGAGLALQPGLSALSGSLRLFLLVNKCMMNKRLL